MLREGKGKSADRSEAGWFAFWRGEVYNRLTLNSTVLSADKPDLDFLNERGVKYLAEVRVGENEPIESALKRFKKKIQKAGILSEIKRRERYEKPSVRRKKKAEAARKRHS